MLKLLPQRIPHHFSIIQFFDIHFKNRTLTPLFNCLSSSRYALTIACLLLLSLPTHSKIMVGAYQPEDGWSQEAMEAFNQEIGKEVAFTTIFTNFNHNWEQHLKHQSNNVLYSGSIPLISLMPIDETRPDVNILTEIVDGQWDDYLTTWAKGLKSWFAQFPQARFQFVYLRFGHEFNGDWYSYANHPIEFVAAWQHIHDLFDTFRFFDIQWVWTANHLSFDEYNDITLYYPGDEYVDWTGIDGYNWGDYFPFSSWRQFEYIFAPTYRTLIEFFPTKPIMINQFSSVSPADRSPLFPPRPVDVSQDRREWFRSALSMIREEFPAIRAVSFFNKDKGNLHWSLDDIAINGEQKSGLKGVQEALQDHYFTHYSLATWHTGWRFEYLFEKDSPYYCQPPLVLKTEEWGIYCDSPPRP